MVPDPLRQAAVARALAAAAEPGEVAWFAAPTGGRLVLGQVHGARTRALPGLMVAVGRGLTGKAAANVRPEFVDDYFAADTITHDFDRVVAAEAITRMLAVPVRCGPRVLGVVTVGVRTPGRFGDRRIDAVTARARELGQALRRLDERPTHDWLHELSSAVAELRRVTGDDPAVAAILARLERSTGGLGRVVREPEAPPHSLTVRQRQILELVSQGCTNAEIGQELGLTKNTVKTYWQQTLAELGARNRVEAIRLAGEAGLI